MKKNKYKVVFIDGSYDIVYAWNEKQAEILACYPRIKINTEYRISSITEIN